MGGGESKAVKNETAAKLMAFNAMQEQLQKLEQDVKLKDKMLAEAKEAASSSGKTTKKKKKAVQKRVDKQAVDPVRMAKLAKISTWSLDADVDEYMGQKAQVAKEEEVSEVEVEPDRVQKLLAPKPKPAAISDILQTPATPKDHFKKVQAHMTAINAFKQEFEADLLASRSKLRSRLEKRKSKKSISRASSSSTLGDSMNESMTEKQAEPPPLPPRPKVTAVKFHTYTFEAGTLGINFEEMNEPPFSMFVWSVINGWQGEHYGVEADDVLVEINGKPLDNLDFDMVMDLLLSSPRPMTLKLRRDLFDAADKSDNKMVEAKQAGQLEVGEVSQQAIEMEQEMKAREAGNNVGKESEGLHVPAQLPPTLPPRKKSNEVQLPSSVVHVPSKVVEPS